MTSGAGSYFWQALSGGSLLVVCSWLAIVTVRLVRKGMG